MPEALSDALIESPTVALLGLARIYEDRLSVALKPYNLTPRKFAVLSHLCSSPGISVSEVGRCHGISTQSAHAIVVELRRRGLAQSPETRPGTAAHLELTHAGLDLLAAAAEANAQLDDRMRYWNPELTRLLSRVIRSNH